MGVERGIQIDGFIAREDDGDINEKAMQAFMNDFIALVECYGYVTACGWRLEKLNEDESKEISKVPSVESR